MSEHLNEGSIVFSNTDENKPPILELRKDGDILVHGRLVENDKQVVDGLREFLDIYNSVSEVVDDK